jgi:hypothetical protein
MLHGNHHTLQDKLTKAREANMSMFIHGTMGIGKSDAISRWAEKMAERLGLVASENLSDLNDEKKFLVVKLPLHQMDVSEIKGIPFPNDDRTGTVFLPLGLLPTKGQGVIFLDELNLAAPMVQSNAYQLILDRKLGFYSVPDGFTVVAAGNMLDDRGHTFEMANPLKNRFLHYQLNVPTYDEWVKEWAVKNGVDHRIIAFLGFQRDYLYKYDSNIQEEVFTIPTPRAWAFTSKMIQGVNNPEEVEENVSMAVGSAIAMEFVAWMALSTKYDIEGIYAGKDFKIPAEDEVDHTYSLISALVGFYLNMLKTSKESKKKDAKDSLTKYANRLMECVFKFQREHMIMALALVTRQDEEFIMRVDDKLFNEVSEDIFKML